MALNIVNLHTVQVTTCFCFAVVEKQQRANTRTCISSETSANDKSNNAQISNTPDYRECPRKQRGDMKQLVISSGGELACYESVSYRAITSATDTVRVESEIIGSAI